MRSLLAALLIGASPALADVVPPEPCEGMAQGDACTTENGETGTCDDDLVCIADSPGDDMGTPSDDDDGSGCSTLGSRTTAFGFAVGSLTLLAVAGRRRQETP